ncbi:uncharacterized protein LOC111625893 [Centruroides sculpturatus]|uniref:uncharacterized protein LOC111625893 n=1 Tax=Centruroides sculpturatus TaxID=218467 RepID=UPI000C6E3A96|nr:uncharacterized protein LOC111625893 [Centruroides sculpturatus]
MELFFVLVQAAVWTLLRSAGQGSISHRKAKGISLFTIVQFPNSPCYLPDGQVGTCYNIGECRRLSGLPQGSCARGYGVCCIFQRTCGGIITQNCTYFTNPGYPGTYDGNQSCTVAVRRPQSPKICQLRLDFDDFRLLNPVAGDCISDSFTVTGQNSNNVIPTLCGSNSGQHMYVDVDDSNTLVNLNTVTNGQGPRRWSVKVCQIECNSPWKAPANCLQYYTGITGNFQSFNYDAQNAPTVSGGYPRNLNYAICFRKESGRCTIEYRVKDGSVFAIFNVDAGNEPTVNGGEAGVGVMECPTDYLLLGGIRYCGSRLNPSLEEENPTENLPVTDNTGGPFVVNFVTDSEENAQGFNLDYEQILCSSSRNDTD